jgi:hypothetical protein
MSCLLAARVAGAAAIAAETSIVQRPPTRGHFAASAARVFALTQYGRARAANISLVKGFTRGRHLGHIGRNRDFPHHLPGTLVAMLQT